jgi:hypothetical protein
LGTKPLGSGAVDYDIVVAPEGWHRFSGEKFPFSGLGKPEIIGGRVKRVKK